VSDVERVLIVGGGIGGLTLARALHQQGFDTEVVERNRDWRTDGAGLSVQPNGMRVLKHLGLGTPVLDAGRIVGRWLFADQFGEVLCDIDLEEVWSDVGPFVGIARSRLQEALVGGARGVPCRLGSSITEIDQDDRQVSVGFTDGSTRDYDLVVGADGIRSTVRALVFGAVEPTFAGQVAWRSVAPFTLPGSPSVQFWLGDGCFFGLCSVGDAHTYGFGYVAQEQRRDPLEGRLGRLREQFAGFGDNVRDYLASVDRDEQIHCSSIEWVDHDRWHQGRVVLIGDAAHASSPMMGQGGSLAMEDGWVLARLLRSEPSLAQALSAYTERRRPRVSWVQQQSQRVAASFNLPSQARNEALRERGVAMFADRYAPLTPEP